MVFSINTLNPNGVISPKIYQLNTANETFENFISFMTEISETLIIESSLIETPISQVFEYLDRMNHIRFTILDIDIDKYINENYPETKNYLTTLN